MIYLYDGSFAGFLSSVFQVFDRKDNDAVINLPGGPVDIFSENAMVSTDLLHAERVWKALSVKISRQALADVYAAFLSENMNAEAALLGYMKYIFSEKSASEKNFANPYVLRIAKLAKVVYRERHRMEAFVRFRLTTDAIFYATVSPDFNVLPLLVNHFTRRFADQRWLIYDLKRRYGLYYDLEKTTSIDIQFTPEAAAEVNIFHPDEAAYVELWRNYFHSVNIPARKNMKLHIRHIPLRYWQYMTEKKQKV